jgi:hypothetical protein
MTVDMIAEVTMLRIVAYNGLRSKDVVYAQLSGSTRLAYQKISSSH